MRSVMAYMGLQLVMVALVIAFPDIVSAFLESAAPIDMEKAGKDVQEQIERALNPQ